MSGEKVWVPRADGDVALAVRRAERAEDDVVMKPDAENLAGLAQHSRDFDVLRAGRRIAVGVVVRDDDGACADSVLPDGSRISFSRGIDSFASVYLLTWLTVFFAIGLVSRRKVRRGIPRLVVAAPILAGSFLEGRARRASH